MKLFISHAHEEATLALALRSLLKNTGTNLDAFYSSSPDTNEGITVGRWRDKIGQELRDADTVIAILTPESRNKPWIYFETAYALGHSESINVSELSESKYIIPIIYFMDKEHVASPLQDLQIYDGEDEEDLSKLYKVLVNRLNQNAIHTDMLKIAIEKYLNDIKQVRNNRFDKSLFHGHFHNHTLAQKIEGDWHAIWTEIDENGQENMFEGGDVVNIWSTGERLRMVGKGKDWADYYPMEGVLASTGRIALSYWGQDEIPICGTVLLHLIGGNRIMKGHWIGHTAKSLDEELRTIQGNAYLARDKEKLEKVTAHLSK